MADTKTLTGARFIAETLKGYGVTHVFYVDAMLRKAMVDLEELGIRRVVTHSEKAAAYMADGYARVSGRAGVCMAQSVGAANLAAGLQDACLAGSPVVALTGKKPPLWQYRNAYQEIHHWPLFEPVTKFNADVVAPEQLPHLLRQAFREAVSGKPGPVHLDMVGREARELEVALIAAPVSVDERFVRYPPFRPAPDADAVAAAARAIEIARRPIIVAGGGVRISGAAAELVALAEKRRIPVATTVDGKGSIPETHPLSVGVVGNYSAWCANKAVCAADLVIFVGSGTGDQTTNSWQVPAIGTPIVQIDIDPVELGRNYPDTAGVLGDAKVALQTLTAALEPSAGSAEWLAFTRQLVAEWRSGNGLAALFRRGAHPPRTDLQRADRSHARGRHPRHRHRLLRDLGGDDAAHHQAHADLHPRGRVAGVGVPRFPWGQGGRAGAPGHLLHRRRWFLVPLRRAGDGAPPPPPHGHCGQQQQRSQPGYRGCPSHVRRPPRRPNGTLSLRAGQLCTDRQGYGLFWHPCGEARRDRACHSAGAGSATLRRWWK